MVDEVVTGKRKWCMCNSGLLDTVRCYPQLVGEDVGCGPERFTGVRVSSKVNILMLVEPLFFGALLTAVRLLLSHIVC